MHIGDSNAGLLGVVCDSADCSGGEKKGHFGIQWRIGKFRWVLKIRRVYGIQSERLGLTNDERTKEKV